MTGKFHRRTGPIILSLISVPFNPFPRDPLKERKGTEIRERIMDDGSCTSMVINKRHQEIFVTGRHQVLPIRRH